MNAPLLKKTAGFTLMEILIVVGILIFLGGALATFQVDVFRFNTTTQSGLSTNYEIRRTLKNFTADLRTASPSSVGAFPLGEMSSSSLVFYANIDTDLAIERVHYFVSSSTLWRGILKPTGSPLTYSGTESLERAVTGVLNSSIFSYHATGEVSTSTLLYIPLNPQNVTLVRLSLSVDKDILKPPGTTHAETSVLIRNLKVD